MKFFEPFTTQPPSFFAAVVRVPEASDPAPGSVRPHAPRCSPRASGARYLCFCELAHAHLHLKLFFSKFELHRVRTGSFLPLPLGEERGEGAKHSDQFS